jgi:hypothetical protein
MTSVLSVSLVIFFSFSIPLQQRLENSVTALKYINLELGDIQISSTTRYFICFYFVVLGYIVVIVLPLDPKICGFKPSRRRWYFNGDKKSVALLPSEGK